eukprot:CFRG3796T1
MPFTRAISSSRLRLAGSIGRYGRHNVRTMTTLAHAPPFAAIRSVVKTGRRYFQAPPAIYQCVASHMLQTFDDPNEEATKKWKIEDLREVQPYVYLLVPRDILSGKRISVLTEENFQDNKEWDSDTILRNKTLLRRWASDHEILSLNEMGDCDLFKKLGMNLTPAMQEGRIERLLVDYIDEYASGDETDGYEDGEHPEFSPRELKKCRENRRIQNLDIKGDNEVPYTEEQLDAIDKEEDYSIFLDETEAVEAGLINIDGKEYRLLHIHDVEKQIGRECRMRPEPVSENMSDDEILNIPEYIPESISIGVSYKAVEANMLDLKEIDSLPAYHKPTSRAPATAHTLATDLRLISRRLALHNYSALTPACAVYVAKTDQDEDIYLNPIDALKLAQKSRDIVLDHAKSAEILGMKGLAEYVTRTAVKALVFLGHYDEAVAATERAISVNPELKERVWDVYLLALLKQGFHKQSLGNFVQDRTLNDSESNSMSDVSESEIDESGSDTQELDSQYGEYGEEVEHESSEDGERYDDSSIAENKSEFSENESGSESNESTSNPEDSKDLPDEVVHGVFANMEVMTIYEKAWQLMQEENLPKEKHSCVRVPELPALMMSNARYLVPFAKDDNQKTDQKTDELPNEVSFSVEVEADAFKQVVSRVFSVTRGVKPTPDMLTALLKSVNVQMNIIHDNGLYDEAKENDKESDKELSSFDLLLPVATQAWSEISATQDDSFFTIGNFAALTTILTGHKDHTTNCVSDIWERFTTTSSRKDDTYYTYERSKFLLSLMSLCRTFREIETAKNIVSTVLGNDQLESAVTPLFWEFFFGAAVNSQIEIQDMCRAYAFSLPSVFKIGHPNGNNRTILSRHTGHTYQYLMEKCVRENDPITCLRFLRDMVYFGIQPTQKHYQLVIQSCRKPFSNTRIASGVDAREVLVLETIITEHAVDVFDWDENIATAYNVPLILEMFCATAQFDRALNLFKMAHRDYGVKISQKVLLDFITSIKDSKHIKGAKLRDEYLLKLATAIAELAKDKSRPFEVYTSMDSALRNAMSTQPGRAAVKKIFFEVFQHRD